MDFHYPSSVALARLPTPIHELERLSRAWGGPTILLKRDDLTGCALSGNKVRKLEFSVAEALEQGADTLITCGGSQSNHARATAVVAARMGMQSVLVLRGKDTLKSEGNLFIDRLVGSRIRFITEEAYNHIDDLMAGVAADLREEGRTPYIIPEGASNAVGLFGYIRAAEEIAAQLKASKTHVDYIVTATGSGGTLGGLLLGEKIFAQDWQPVGINVCDTADMFQERINGVINSFIQDYCVKVDIESKDITLIDGYVGDGYAVSRPEERELIVEVAKVEGIILDSVYTGKAMFGLRDQIRQGRFREGQTILFIHTGGMLGLLPQGGAFDAMWGG